MEKFKSRISEIFGGLQTCTFSLAAEVAYYLEAIAEYIEDNKENVIPFCLLNKVEEYCPGFLNYLKNNMENTKISEDKITRFTLPEVGEIQVVYED